MRGGVGITGCGGRVLDRQVQDLGVACHLYFRKIRSVRKVREAGGGFLESFKIAGTYLTRGRLGCV